MSATAPPPPPPAPALVQHRCGDCLISGLSLHNTLNSTSFRVTYCKCKEGIIEKSNKKHWHCPLCNFLSVSNRQERIDRHLKKHPGLQVESYGLTVRCKPPGSSSLVAAAAATLPAATRPNAKSSSARSGARGPSLPIEALSSASSHSDDEPQDAIVPAQFQAQVVPDGSHNFAARTLGMHMLAQAAAAQVSSALANACVDPNAALFEDLIVSDAMYFELLGDLAVDSWMHLEHQTEPSAMGKILLPLMRPTPWAPSVPLPAPLGTPHAPFRLNVGRSALKNIDGRNLSCYTFTVSGDSGVLFDHVRVNAVAMNASSALALFQPVSIPAGPSDFLSIVMYQPLGPDVISSVLVTMELTVISAAGVPSRQYLQQVLFLPATVPTKIQVGRHLELLLQTVYAREFSLSPDRWVAALEVFRVALSLDIFLEILCTELQPEGFMAVRGELHGLAYAATPQELETGLRHLLATRFAPVLMCDAVSWETVCQALGTMRANSDLPRLLAALHPMLPGYAPITAILRACPISYTT